MADFRMLIIRTGGLGDSLLLWPAVAAVRRRFPDARLELLGHPDRLRPLVVPGGADAAHDVEGSGLHRLFDLTPEIPTEVRSFFGGFQVVVAFAAPGDFALAENLSACGAGEVHAFLPFPSEGQAVHVADHAKQSLCGVNLATDGEDPLLPARQDELAAGVARLSELSLEGRPLVALAPGSGSSRKNFHPQGFADILQTLRDEGLEPVLFQGPADATAVDAVRSRVRGRPPMVLRDDPPSRLKGILARCGLYLGNDGGVTHLAALMGIPTVAVFGPSDPVRWAPKGPRVRVVRRPPPCSPCTAEALQECADRVCLSRVETAEVLEACRSFM